MGTGWNVVIGQFRLTKLRRRIYTKMRGYFIPVTFFEW